MATHTPPGNYRTTKDIYVDQPIPSGTLVTVDDAGKGSATFERDGVEVRLADFLVYNNMIGTTYVAVPRRSKTRRNMRKSRRNRKH
jgi:hypothetical protein